MDGKNLKILEYDKIINILKDFASFDLSRKKLERLMPLKTLADAKNALADTTDAQGLLLRRGTPPFHGASDVTASLKRAEIGSALRCGELLKIARLLRVSRALCAYLNEDNIGECRVKTLFLGLLCDKAFEESIFSAIISDEEVADNASNELYNIRRKKRSYNDKIREILNSVIHSPNTQKFLQESIVTQRDGRYVIPVKAECKSEIPGIVHDSSASGATLFIEPATVVSANNELRELELKEKEEIERILAEFTAFVADRKDMLQTDLHLVSELDFIFAKAAFGLSVGGNAPSLNSSGIISLNKARHPLIPKDKVVPIDFSIGRGYDTLVITGPNTGGKTVALKTVGLLTLMALSGLHIPAAENSEIAFYEKIFADIGDEQSIEQSLSTFSSHMKNIVGIIKEADDKTLALFDELGAGTDPEEGAALAVSLLTNLRNKGATLVSTTHYSELKLFALSTEGVINASCEFNVETLSPTYKLLIGIPGKSNAFAISKKLGLPEDVIFEATKLLSKDTIKIEEVLEKIETSRKEAEESEKKASLYLEEIERLKKSFKELKESGRISSEKLIEDANKKALEIIEEAKIKADNYLKELNALKFRAARDNVQKDVEKHRQSIKNELEKRNREQKEQEASGALNVSLKDLLPGTSVILRDIGKKATILKAPTDPQSIYVQAGIMKITTNIRNIKLDKNSEGSIKNIGVQIKKSYSVSNMSVSTEIDLRGDDLESAILRVQKFIDDASIANLKTVTVIHGKGTGVLRKGIHEILKSNPLVETYRLGKYGEGETGVTVVELK